MTLCKMEEIEGRPGFQWCQVCQRQRFWPQEQKSPKALPENYRRECAGVPSAEVQSKPSKPDFTQQVTNYRNARARQKAAGNPIRPDAEKELLYARCQECPSEKFIADPLLPIFSGGGQCGACGCGMSPVRKMFNAAAWGSYKCKLGHWDDLIAAWQVSYVEVPSFQNLP